jgi:hypothetical protein
LWDGKLLSHHLSQPFGVDIGVWQCQRIFHQLVFHWRKPRPVIANADPVAQQKFKKLRRLAIRNDIDLWFEDECHFQQHGSLCAMWIPPKEVDLIVLHAPARKSIGIFGAVRMLNHKP